MDHLFDFHLHCDLTDNGRDFASEKLNIHELRKSSMTLSKISTFLMNKRSIGSAQPSVSLVSIEKLKFDFVQFTLRSGHYLLQSLLLPPVISLDVVSFDSKREQKMICFSF